MTPVDYAAWLWRNSPECRSWGWKPLFGWIRHSFKWNGVIHAMEGGELTGVGVARSVRTNQENDYFAHDQRGGVVWIDLVVTKSDGAIRKMWREMRRRFPMQFAVGFQRKERGERIVLKPIERMNKFLMP